jgi:hypothetical protein
MRVFQVTMDSSCFSPAEDYADVEVLKCWQDKGWVDLIKTGVLERENKGDDSGQYIEVLRAKTKGLSLDYGIVVYGAPGTPNGEHIPGEYMWWYGTGRSKFEQIHEVLFGKNSQQGKKSAGNIRDALHYRRSSYQ